MNATAETMIQLPSSTTPVLLAAEIYAGLGFSVIPLHGIVNGKCSCGQPMCPPRSYGKHPVPSGWQKKATSNIDDVRELFRGHRGNIGIMLGREFVVIDIDGAEGFESLRQLGDLPPTLTQRSGSGVGEHLVYRFAPHHNPDAITNRPPFNKVDVKTRNGQMAVAPSLHASGKRYEWVNAVMPATLPEHVYQKIVTPKVAPVISLPVRQTALAPDTYKRAAAYLERIPPAISGSGGHAQTFAAARAVAAWVAHHGLSRNDAWSLFTDYNDRCQPPWSERELRHKFDEAFSSAHTLPELEDRPRMSATLTRPTPTTHTPLNSYSDSDISGSPPEGPPPEQDWRSRLVWEHKKDKTVAAKHVENAVVVLRYCPDWKGKLRLDTHSHTVTVQNPPWHETNTLGEPDTELRPWSDSDSVRLSSWIRRELSIDLSRDICDQAVHVVAEANPYHPVRDYFDGLRWDGVPRLSTAPTVYFGAVLTDYTSLVFRWWMLAAANRIYRPGCKADNVLILEGPQGLKKSTALKTLAGDAWFSDTPIDLSSKDAYLALQGKLIVELAELESLRKADAARAKAFFTSTTDSFRPPYGKRNITVPRGCVFAGTVNHASYLQDPTGNRRYWPIACTSIDLEAIARDRDQLWAEAVAHRTHRYWPESPDELKACEDAQTPRAEGDEWDAVIGTWLARPNCDRSFTIGDILGDALGLPKGQWGRHEQMRVASSLQRLGYVRRQVRHGSTRAWRYVSEFVTNLPEDQ